MKGALAPASLASRLRTAPTLLHPALAEERVAGWLALLQADAPLRSHAEMPAVRALFRGLAEHSPFLWHLASSDPERCASLLSDSPEASLAREIGRLENHSWDNGRDGPALMQTLRRAKQAVALLIALVDLGGVWSLEEVTHGLTLFADIAVRTAFRALLREAERAGKLRPPVSQADPEAGSGLVVLALGKQGGGELNYSSDIDLVVFFDPAAPRLPVGCVPSQFFVRMTQQVVRLLQERTADGYVLRVDLRLRPDPASTAVAIGLPSAFDYYENRGQNWERAAFIKARPVAGDVALGARFLDELSPFIWRKYFDYGAIADIHAMKRQIHAVRGQAEVAVPGHDVKLGRGGIREIEFFVQTQQLIFGGRRPRLRGRQTVAMLAELTADGWIDEAAASALGDAYRMLRTTEHRLQMVADEQTQRLPEDDAGLERFARFAGYPDRTAFAEAITTQFRTVEAHYARLFEHAPRLDAVGGSLVFTGTAADPETIETLRSMGFTRPADAAEIVRGWHFGRRAAVQTMRAREVLTELTPALLGAFAGSAGPDAALATFDTMLGRMTAAVELLSMLRSNEALRNLVADILGSAPRLAATIATRPHVLDAAIDPAGLRGAEIDRNGDDRVAVALNGANSTEEFLDRAREVAREEMFLIGVRLLGGAAPERAGDGFSHLAGLIIRATLDRCLVDFEREHGRMPGGACVVLGMGKLGSREMTASSDLDLILIYRFDAEAGPSGGSRPLDGTRYFTRLTQRLIATLTAPTRRGKLYDVDLRLRPSGKQGPLAVRMSAFVGYQADEAQTWEHLALTRARVVAGDPALAADVEAVIRTTLVKKRDPGALQADVRTMRALIAREKGETDFWNTKLVAGGLLDVEFIAQYLVLRFAETSPSLLLHAPPAIIAEACRLGLLDDTAGGLVLAAYRTQAALAQLISLSIEGPFDPARAGAGVVRRLCAVANQPDLSALQSELADMRSHVRSVLRELLAWAD